jgi:hypothetical protein
MTHKGAFHLAQNNNSLNGAEEWLLLRKNEATSMRRLQEKYTVKQINTPRK